VNGAIQDGSDAVITPATPRSSHRDQQLRDKPYGGTITALDWTTGKEKATYLSPLIGSPRNPPGVTSFGVHAEVGGKILTADRALEKDLWKHEEEADMWVDDIQTSGDTLAMSTRNGKIKALSGSDGKLLWSYTTPSFGLIDKDMAIDDEVVYASSKDGSVYALDLITGKNVWTTKLDGGPALDPRITGSILITADKSYIHAIDKKTGKKIWKHSSPAHVRVVAVAGQVIDLSPLKDETWVESRDAATGELHWIFSGQIDGKYLAASPTHVYVRTDKEIHAYEVTTRNTTN
ncbi:PQQ-binding-like beta-propeller repeat protein, partial [Streptomyces sp. NPDC058611]|uniref:outer membrane protein assembly factor BamB family protein n=1 Tax=unclassified Streptomyces TaxID=2593676 RepID=UPI003646D26D